MPLLHPISVDDREQKPHPKVRALELQRLNVPASVQHLPVGDYMWAVQRDDESIISVIVERKTINDFLSSIPPSDRLPRFVEETSKYPCVRAILLEGNQFDYVSHAKFNIVEPDALDNMLADLQTLGIIVLRTKSEHTAAGRLARFWKWSGEHDHRTFLAPVGPSMERNYLSTDERDAVRMLMCLPGLGEDKARRVIDEFGSVWSALIAIAGHDYKAFGSVKGVSKGIVDNIARVLGT